MPARHLLLTCSLLLAAVACGDDADESTAVGSCGAGPAVGDRALRVATTVAPITNLVAILLLSGLVVKLAKDYNAQRAAGKLPSFDAREYPEIRSRLEPGIWD